MKTIDGIRLRDLARVATQIGAEVREGTNHPYILTYQNLRPCPIASSTHAERMVTPWIMQATGRNKREVYRALKQGYWN